MSTWFEIVTPIALIEPTFFGELVLIAEAVIIRIAAAFSIVTISTMMSVYNITLSSVLTAAVGLTFGFGSNLMGAAAVVGIKRSIR